MSIEIVEIENHLKHDLVVPRDAVRKTNSESFDKNVAAAREEYQSRSSMEWLETFVPMVKWLRIYNFKANIVADIIAGLTVTAVIIPQSMSFAKLAGLPVQFGLYSSFVPIYAYSVFGTSRQLAIGTSAVSSLTFDSVMNTMNPNMTALEYQTTAVRLALMVGILYTAMGILRLGFITNFISGAVISGFTSGSALIIGFSQLKFILGYNVTNTDKLPQLIKSLIMNISQFNYKTFVLGCLCVICILSMKHIGMTYKRFSWIKALGPITVCVVSILVSWLADLHALGIPTISSIPAGLPPVTIEKWSPLSTDYLLPVVILVIIGFMESISIAKKMAMKHRYEIDGNLELIGLGMANFVGSMFSIYPVVGSISRTAVNNDAGATSAISGIITATMVMLVLLLLTSVFEYLPYAVLASIVISAVVSIFDLGEVIYLWKVHKLDCFTWLVSFLCTALFGVQIGLLCAVICSILITLYESAYPHTAVLGRLPGTTVYRDIKQYPNAEQHPGIVFCRIDAPLYFANAQFIREKLDKYETAAPSATGDHVQYVILDLSPNGNMDTTSLRSLEELLSDYKTRSITLCLCNPSKSVMELLVMSNFIDKIGYNNIFVSEHQAVGVCTARMGNAVALGSPETEGSDSPELDADGGLSHENEKEPKGMEDDDWR